jgi:tetratricopeptide (TPR) repeat protein
MLLASTARRQVLLAILFGLCLGCALAGGLLVALNANLSAAPPITTQAIALPTTLLTPTSTTLPTTSITLTPPSSTATPRPNPSRTPTRAPTIAPDLKPLQASVLLRGLKHDYQKFNNCGPTTLEMNLSFFGRTDTQAEIAAFTKPNSQDKNVRPDEIAAYANRAGFRTLIRVNGNFDLLNLLLSNNLPVIVETGLVKEPQGWMGHYRLVIGYDANQLITMDSYDGPSVKLRYAELDDLWREFNRLYIVIYPAEQEALVHAIVGETWNDATMYAQALARANQESEANPNDAFAQFNRGTSLTGLGRYPEAIAAFERAQQIGLPWRMWWYQFEPFVAYVQAKQYDKAIALANSVLSKAEDLEEAHYYKGLALRGLGREAEAQREFQTALSYNKNYRAAQQALSANAP